jgi:hypothetical protein
MPQASGSARAAGIRGDVARQAEGPGLAEPAGVAEDRLLVARVEALLEVQGGKGAAMVGESVVEREGCALPRRSTAGEVLIAQVGGETRALLEQAALSQGGEPLAWPGGLGELFGGVEEQCLGGFVFLEPFEGVRIRAPDVLVRGRAAARIREDRQRLARAAEPHERLRLAELPVHVGSVLGQELVVLRERLGLRAGPGAGARERIARLCVLRLRRDRRLQRGLTGIRRRRQNQQSNQGDEPLCEGVRPLHIRQGV